MTETDGTAARVRAAQAFAGLSDDELAQALGVSRRTVGRMKSYGDNVDHERRELIASVTGVPAAFMHEGWQALPEEPGLAERVEALERQMQALWTTAPDVETRPERVTVDPAPLVANPPAPDRKRRAQR